MSVHFDAGWCATDLGDHRPCRLTYERYSYDSLPVLDGARFTGAFQWLGEPGEPLPERTAELRRVSELLAAEGLALPADFVKFETASNLRGRLDEVSVTGCWSSLSEPLPSPVEPGAFLVRFFRDQQDCVLWCLYLRPSGEVFVVNSHLDYEAEYEARDEDGWEPRSDLDDPVAQRAAILWCAPTFEQFAYRFWVENRLWYLTDDGPEQELHLDAELRAYLDHYRADPAAAG
ncbi:hypothetical protein [Kitasatospora viridis]|uniref:Uncharacterized protein n=1 Tax=Kitasatospora viridis TaxID=281105 RepID=A0A561SEP4_9ACTN|nr:hypothetical protein [Kitasatospora viridis]TWF73329.1 hypothetical protein FHX73_16480 [Kitasatospora viridis]